MNALQVILQGGPHDGKAGQYIGTPTGVLYSTSGLVAHFSDDPDSAFTPGEQHLIYRRTGEDEQGRTVYAYAGDANDENPQSWWPDAEHEPEGWR